MPRKGPAPRRPLVIDPVYNSTLVSQLVNKILGRGKRSVAEKIVYGALEGAREKTGTDPVVTLKRALDNVKPTIEVKSRRVGGATYQVPVEVKASRSTTLALRWLVGYSRQRREKTMTERLMNELDHHMVRRRPHHTHTVSSNRIPSTSTRWSSPPPPPPPPPPLSFTRLFKEEENDEELTKLNEILHDCTFITHSKGESHHHLQGSLEHHQTPQDPD